MAFQHSSTKTDKFNCREKADSKCPMDARFVRQNSHDNCSAHGQWWLVICIFGKYLPGILSLSLKTVTAASRRIVQVNP
jgi:hypothetical protein